MLSSVIFNVLLPLFSYFSTIDLVPLQPPQRNDSLRFELRHYHALSPDNHVVFSDVPPAAQLTKTPYVVRTRSITTFRPSSLDQFNLARSHLRRTEDWDAQLWEEDEVIGPDVENRSTLLELAKMTNNAYVKPDSHDWYKLERNWTVSYPFGWEPDADGFRGHVFATPDNSTVVLSIKGTSGELWTGGGPTAERDKLNDNILFSCCCARVGWTWTPVCDCYRGNNKCHQDCLEGSLTNDNLFYPIGLNLYNNLTYMYPDSNIWITGHSLGGGVASLLGATFGAPVVTFESPGDKLAAKRLHLPTHPSLLHIVHVYHNADPIPMGTCVGVFSSCSIAGYALETRCHLGKSIVYDTVGQLGWSVNVANHGIVTVIDGVLSHPWPSSEKEGREVPEAKYEDDCVDCYSWQYGNFPR